MKNIVKNSVKNTLKKIRKQATVFVATLLCFTMVAETAFADLYTDNWTNLSCNSSGGVDKGLFFNPQLIYEKYDVSKGDDGCGVVDVKTFFSGIACNFIVTLNSVFSKFYCAVQYAMKEIIWAVITLYFVILGVKLLLGTQEATAGATVAALFKVGILVTFALPGLIGAGLIFSFFSNIIIDSVEWVGKSILCNDPLTFLTCTTTDTHFSSIFSMVDSKIYAVVMGVPDPNDSTKLINGLFSDNGQLLVFYVSLIVLCPGLYILAFDLIRTTFFVLTGALVSTLLCLVVVAFLVSLAPIFLCFMLFGSTYVVFDNWLKYLISYSIQPALIFSILLMWLLVVVDFTSFIPELQKIMLLGDGVNYDIGPKGKMSDDSIRFCQLRFSSAQTTVVLPNPGAGELLPQVTLGGPHITCCQMIDDPNNPWKGIPYAMPPRICDPDPTHNIADVSDALKGPNPTLFAEDLVGPSTLIKDNKFIYFLAYNIISLLVICYAFLNMLKMAPKIAQQLSKAQSTLPLGAGFRPGGAGLGGLISKASSALRGKASKPVRKLAKSAAERATSYVAGAGAASAPGAAPMTGTLYGTSTSVSADNKPFSGNTGSR